YTFTTYTIIFFLCHFTSLFIIFFTDTPIPYIYTLSLHDALPISNDTPSWLKPTVNIQTDSGIKIGVIGLTAPFNAFYHLLDWHVDRKSTRLNSSHVSISYAVFCLKKKIKVQ